MTTVAAERQKLIQDATVSLLHISLGTENWYLTDSIIDPLESVVYGGNTYLARKYRVGKFQVSISGSLPRPRLELDNTDRFWFSLVNDNNDMIGASVVHREVYRMHLDDGASPSLTEIQSEVKYVIIQLHKITSEEVEFRLAVPLDVEQAQIGRTMTRHVCARRYRVPTSTLNQFTEATDSDAITCPYAGSAFFKKNGDSTADWREDDCSNTLAGCKLRFGANSVLPYQGFPAIGAPNA